MAQRVRIRKSIRKVTAPLASAAVGYQGGEVGVIANTHTVGPVSGVTGEKSLGTACNDYSQTAGDTLVEVELNAPIELEYFANGNTLTIASDFLRKVYFSDANTVTSAADNGSGLNYAVAGVLWDVSATDGVGVRRQDASTAVLIS
jgi:hypothetical protein